MSKARLTALFRARLDRLLDLFRRELREVLDEPLMSTPVPSLPASVGEALDRVATDADAYAGATANHLRELVGLLVPEEKYRDAVLEPGRQLAERWPWPVDLEQTTWLLLCAGQYPVVPNDDGSLPGDAARTRAALQAEVMPPPVPVNDFTRVAEQFKDALNAAQAKAGDAVVDFATREPAPPQPGEPLAVNSWPLAGAPAHRGGWTIRCLPEHLALLGRVVADVNSGLRRPAMAIDATPAHHNLLVGWRNLPKTQEPTGFDTIDGRMEIIPPEGRGKPVQLTLFLPDDPSLHTAVLHALRQIRKWKGLRHWAALQRLFSIEGGRRGWVRWTLDEHLDAMGYHERKRRDPNVRKKAAKEVELLTMLELAIYEHNGQERSRNPLIHVGTKFDRLESSEWRLDGMELRINPLLYRGVRDPRTGELGSKFFPVPPELATIDHSRHPYAYPLGLILPCRWQWDLMDPKKHTNHTALSGRSLLAMAGIPFNKHKPGEAWRRLARDLEQLRRIGLLERAVWDAVRPALDGMCRLYPAGWIVDRAVRGLRPLELPPKDVPLTGKELQEWRKARDLTQTATAERLGIGVATVKRAEAQPNKKLSRYVRTALTQRG